MVRHPLVCPASTTAAQAAEAFRDDHLHALLILDGATLLAVVERGDLDDLGGRGDGGRDNVADADTPAWLAGRLNGRTVSPDAALEQTRLALVSAGRRRLAVVDVDGRLLGLLCLKRTGLGFCSDADVRARAEEHGPRVPPVGLEPTLRPF